ncbi:MAG: hypothetical protein GXO93_01255 [FCB group bacterium]|nr:hypothetical protein [FCB group bacterium]
MKKYLLTYSLIIGLLLSMPLPSWSQMTGNDLINKLRNELERTDQIIMRAKEVVLGSNSAKAKFALEQAIKIQNFAWYKFREGTLTGYREAAMLTKQAREKAKYAIANGPYTEQNKDIVLKKLERAQELYQRAKEELSNNQNTNLKAIFSAIEDNLNNAWEFYRKGQQRPALKLCNQVENILWKIIRAANRQQQGMANFERHLENVKELLERARQNLAECNSENGSRFLKQAQISYQLANELARQKRPLAALKALQNSRKFARQALQDCNGFAALNKRYEKTKNNADRINETISSANENAKKLMKQVYEQLALAKDFISKEQTEAAVASLKAAQLTLNQVIKLLNQSGL